MKITTRSGHITIADDNPIAVKIRQGYDYEVVNDEIKVKQTKGRFNLEAFTEKLKTQTATLKEIQEYLLTQINNGNR